MVTGKFFTIEGIDGSGKTTLINNLKDQFKNENKFDNFLFVKEPGGSKIGGGIRSILFNQDEGGIVNINRSASSLLFLADHIELVENTIKPSLTEGKTVISDRYFPDSQYAYMNDDDVVLECHLWVHAACLHPDRTILLVIPPELAMKRISERGDNKQKAKPWSNIESLESIQNKYINHFKDNHRCTVLHIDNHTTEEKLVKQARDVFGIW